MTERDTKHANQLITFSAHILLRKKKAKQMLENTCHGKHFRKELIIYI